MEALYRKLHDKYTRLKDDKFSQFDKLNHDQEVKFLNYTDVADEMIQYLKSENDMLHEQTDELKNELASLRASSEQQCIHLQKLLKEENQRNKELCDKISRLQKVEDKECSSSRHTMSKEVGHAQENLHNSPGEQTQDASLVKSTKKRKSIHISVDAFLPNADVGSDCPSDQLVYRDKNNFQQPACCPKKTFTSGGDDADTSSLSCIFQYLFEFVVGLKVSPLSKSNEVSVMANHPSSGYSFSLTLITNSHGEGEAELLYRVSSLGTFERVAPEWMKETLLFSTSMCRVFFQRVSRVINS